VKPALNLCSGIAATLTNTSAVCTTFISFFRTHQDRYTAGRRKGGAGGAAAKRRKNGSKMDIFNLKNVYSLPQEILKF